MRPFVKRQEAPWRQQGSNIQITQQLLSYQKQNFKLTMEENQSGIMYRKLSFELSLEPYQKIQVAYSIPYTYTQLLQDIRHFKKKAEQLKQITFEIDLSYQSLSGLEIPILRIKSKSKQSKGKYCAFIIARQHPGQSNSNYVLKGTIQQLLSGSNISLQVLNHYDFHIVPMVNPDGVVGGNFRTSLFGKDLNRLFKTKDTTLLPQIEMIKTLCQQLSETYKKKMLLFLDYHGHSTRKNCFVLGPGIFDANMLNDIRVLPKMMGSYSQIFRYPSCSFRLEENKKKTARAMLGKISGLSYTIETSNWSFYRASTGKISQFDAETWQQLGARLMQATENFMMEKIQLKKKYQQQLLDTAQLKIRVKDKKLVEPQIKTSKQIASSNVKLKVRQKRTMTQTKTIQSDDFQILQKITSKLRKIPQQHEQENILMNNIPQQVVQANESDQMSQKGMDTDSSNQDMDQSNFKQYIKDASQMLIEFEKVYYGDNYRKGLSKYNAINKSTKFVKNKKKNESIQACLKYKNAQIQKIDQVVKQSNIISNNEERYSRNNIKKKNSLMKLKIQPEKVMIRNQKSFKQQTRKVGLLYREESPKQIFSSIQKIQKADYQRLKQKQKLKLTQSPIKRQIKIKSRNQQAQSQSKQINHNIINLPFIKVSKHNLIGQQQQLMSTLNYKNQFINQLISSYSNTNHTILNTLRKSKMNEY